MNKGLLFIFAGLFGASLGLAAEKTDGNAKGYGASGYGAEGYSESGYGAKGYSASNGELGYNQGVGYGELGYGSIGYDPPKKDKKKGFFAGILGPKPKSDSSAAAPAANNAQKSSGSSSAAEPAADVDIKKWGVEYGLAYASSDVEEDVGFGIYQWIGIRRRFGSTIGFETGLDFDVLVYRAENDYSYEKYTSIITGIRIPALVNLELGALHARAGVAYEIPLSSSLSSDSEDDYYGGYDYYDYYDDYYSSSETEIEAESNLKLIISAGVHLGPTFEMGYTYTSDLSQSFTIGYQDFAMSSHGLYMAFNF